MNHNSLNRDVVHIILPKLNVCHQLKFSLTCKLYLKYFLDYYRYNLSHNFNKLISNICFNGCMTNKTVLHSCCNKYYCINCDSKKCFCYKTCHICYRELPYNRMSQCDKCDKHICQYCTKSFDNSNKSCSLKCSNCHKNIDCKNKLNRINNDFYCDNCYGNCSNCNLITGTTCGFCNIKSCQKCISKCNYCGVKRCGKCVHICCHNCVNCKNEKKKRCYLCTSLICSCTDKTCNHCNNDYCNDCYSIHERYLNNINRQCIYCSSLESNNCKCASCGVNGFICHKCRNVHNKTCRKRKLG